MGARPVPAYSLTGENSARAIEKGLAEADWYTCPVPKAEMRRLLERRNGPAVRDTLIWLALLAGSALCGVLWWGSPWAIIPFAVYGVMYGTSADSRWHEAGHGTAFRTDWMNDALYEFASFLMMRNATAWRWSHNRHHSDTIIVGRDPEIAVPRPPSLTRFYLAFFGVLNVAAFFRGLARHCVGRLSVDEKSYIPVTEHGKVFWRARLYAAVYLGAAAAAVSLHSVLPLMLVGLPNLYGAWLGPIFTYTQHAGLAENVLDHRLNCRTVYMNPVFRFLYWNMNYHVEHHMFPLVPYHALPRLHELVRPDMPAPYPGTWHAWKELFPAILRQHRDPDYYVRRTLPPPALRAANRVHVSSAPADAEGWVEVCPAGSLGVEDAIRFDHGRKTYAVYRDSGGAVFATDGMCTHGNTHLADGLVKDGLIECAKHNGRFRLVDGAPARAPVCRAIATYPVQARGGSLFMNVARPGGAGAREVKTFSLRVVAAGSVATFIRELVLEPAGDGAPLDFTPGDYLQFRIPPFESIRFSQFDIPQPFRPVWERHRLFDLVAHNPDENRWNNYSMANNPRTDPGLRFNVRIATPPVGQACPPGAGSAWVFSLKPGDVVTAAGPFGDFHVKPTQKEMIYIGGGAGMAPLRSHISHLLETEQTMRKVSYWYGARSLQEVFYRDYFEGLARRFANFSFHLALSSPLPEDDWNGLRGMIHEVVLRERLESHPNPRAVEYYLCGPPMMIRACTKMLEALGVPPDQVSFDEF